MGWFVLSFLVAAGTHHFKVFRRHLFQKRRESSAAMLAKHIGLGFIHRFIPEPI